MSVFSQMFATSGLPVLKHYTGESASATLTPQVGDPITGVTIILGAERTDADTSSGDVILVRRRTVSVDPSDATPRRGWRITFGGEEWTVIGTESESASMVSVIVERPEVQELGRPGYRKR